MSSKRIFKRGFLEKIKGAASWHNLIAIFDKGDSGRRNFRRPNITFWPEARATRTLKKMIKWRSAIELIIGRIKTDGRLNRNLLKGSPSDALPAVLCGAGHNNCLLIRICTKIRQSGFWHSYRKQTNR